MATKLYVGNLSYATTEQDLSRLFSEFGTVASAQVITDRETNQPRGFAFVEMSTESEATAAIDGLNGRNVEGRSLTVNESRPRESGGGSRGGGGGYGGGGGGRSGGYGGGGSRGGGGGGSRW